MSNSKQLIERNLKFSDKYVYLEIVRGSVESAQFTCCDNCGKLITNMVKIVRKEDGKQFTIGTDCTETLAKAKCLYNNGQATDYYLDLYSYNKCARLVTEIKKGAKIEKIGLISVGCVTEKGKKLDAYLSDMKKYFPQYV